MDKLKDIKPIVEVSDTSFYLFLIVMILCLVVIAFLVYKFIKWYKNRKEIYYFDLNNPKETAYTLIKLIRDKEDAKEYIDKLHNYTYKKEVPPFDKALFDEIVKKYKIKYKNK